MPMWKYCMGKIGDWIERLIGANKAQTSWQQPIIYAKNNANIIYSLTIPQTSVPENTHTHVHMHRHAYTQKQIHKYFLWCRILK